MTSLSKPLQMPSAEETKYFLAIERPLLRKLHKEQGAQLKRAKAARDPELVSPEEEAKAVRIAGRVAESKVRCWDWLYSIMCNVCECGGGAC